MKVKLKVQTFNSFIVDALQFIQKDANLTVRACEFIWQYGTANKSHTFQCP